MKYFFDTEFIEDGKTIDLLSIGMIAEDGRELYLCNQDAKLDKADEWVIWNVYPYLPLKHSDWWYWNARKIDVDNQAKPDSLVVPHYEIRDRVRKFVGDDKLAEFWAYYADYDWIVLCQLFGRMVDLPAGWPMFCMDLKQLAVSLGARLPQQTSVQHHALDDAKWVRDTYFFLRGL
jgi:hypothetical protein